MIQVIQDKRKIASVIVCAYNRLFETTIPFMENLKAVTSYPHELICVDDGSTDDGATIRFFQEVCSNPIRISPNMGVAVARNLGFLAAQGDPIVFIDNDMFPGSGWLSTLIQELGKDPNLGILGGIPSNEIARLNRQASPDGLIDFSNVAGACMAVTRRCHRSVGYFDERLVNAGEDTDFCYRAADRGFRIASTPRLVIEHFNGGTRRYMDKSQMTRSAQYMRQKYLDRPELPMPPLSPFGNILPVIL